MMLHDCTRRQARGIVPTVSLHEVVPLDPTLLRHAANQASGDLVTRLSLILRKFDLPDEAGPIAAAGAACVADVGNWAAQLGLMSVETAVIVQNLAMEAIEALQAIGLPGE